MFFTLDTLEETQLTRLDDYALLHITGKDALEFLSNQFTNDLKGQHENTSSLSAWCSVKGRVLYLFRIWREGDDFFLILPTVHTESFVKRLRMYILRAEVKVELSDQHHVLGLSGKDLDALLIKKPDQENEYCIDDTATIIRLPAPVTRYLIITKEASFKAGSLEASTDNNTWQLLDIMAGIAEVLPETSDKFLPQMLDLENLGGLSFQKGCYPGQEIVARVKYRGEVKKQLYQAIINSDTEVLPGTSLFAADSDSENSVGFVVNSASLTNERGALLAVIDIKTANEKSLRLADNTEVTLIIQKAS